ncbi:outer dense fiber protein 2-like isoform X1 [Corythoichthys intestinalis]|uniref:outer dense fiber protein 2-like isoform X1 n=1 Tax=Corythoichthys intestinalis TaxID=161448 RepID=UPI0025A59ACC|nr:outer dense fiber protein 2-like isoform X1 [Corythoichthys intestinalis]
MRTRHSPPPVHVHVVESTPVHVHMRRSPSRTPQERGRDAQTRGDRGRSTARAPWIPPGISSCRRDQKTRVQSENVRRESDNQDDDTATLRKNLSLLLKEQENRQCSNKTSSETELLLRSLVEAEVDSVAVANQLTSFKETLDSLAKDKRPSKLQASALTRQRHLLVEKMEIFDNTNHSLRDLLRDWSHQQQREADKHAEENEAIKMRLADVEAENIRLVSELSDKEKEASQLAQSLDFEKDHAKTTDELSRILASTRDHLESQLSRVQAEKVTMAAQLQRLQQAYEKRRENDDEAALALLTQHAERAEEASRQMGAKLQEKESQLSQALSTCSELRLRISKEATARSQLEDNIAALKLQVGEWNAQHHVAEERSRAEREELRDQLHRLSAQNTAVELDKQSLHAQVTSSEEKLRVVQEEMRQLRTSYKKQEAMVDKYKRKAQQAELQCEEQRLKLNESQLEVRETVAAREREQEHLRKELVRLRQLETLPERLRRSEQQLAQVQQEADAHQRRNLEHHAALAEVRHKVEQQGSQLEASQRRNMLLQEENNVLKEKIHNLERKLESMQVENKEMCSALTLKEVSVLSAEQQLDQKSRENAVLAQQLQQTLDDAQRQARHSVERVLDKERRSQSKALDLQEQLSRAESQLCQLQRSKDEMERRFQNQLKNLKERLDQSDQTNRSLQNYVRFLKTSYGNVFSEPLIPN